MTSLPAWQRFPALRLEPRGRLLRVLDQTRLPFAVRYRAVPDVDTCVTAIRHMWVRGAPLIGLTGAAGMVLACADDPRGGPLREAAGRLVAARPTAVNLSWAVAYMLERLLALPSRRRMGAAPHLYAALERAEFACCERIGAHGLPLMIRAARTARVRRRDGILHVLTHCNAGWLATGAWGTALAPVYHAAAAGVPLHVWVDETRPRNQGARLTAWELAQAGIPHTVIADNAAGHLMQRGRVDLCIVGSDRTTRRGDVCNKIGTYKVALAAADNRIPFYVALPVSTIDWAIEDGVAEIEIESRDPAEVLETPGAARDGKSVAVRSAAPGSVAANFAFDVTPARLVRRLVCEHGVFAASARDLRRLRAIAEAAP